MIHDVLICSSWFATRATRWSWYWALRYQSVHIVQGGKYANIYQIYSKWVTISFTLSIHFKIPNPNWIFTSIQPLFLSTVEDIKPGRASVHGIIMRIPTPFPLENPSVCNSTQPSCPLQAGNQYNYTYQLPVSSSYPSVRFPILLISCTLTLNTQPVVKILLIVFFTSQLRLNVKWELKDSSDEAFVCVEMPVQLRSR